ncbi:MAG: hypothetical protein NTZ80_00470, partial [Patescibacteria group bacterium]|nr:hypothetical protein [Patescibacteria group bacterium]
TLALLTAVSPPLVNQSRFVWNSFPATFFIFLVYFFIYLSFKNKKFLYLAAFFSSFIYNFELAMAIPMVISIIFYALFILQTKKLKDYFYFEFLFLNDEMLSVSRETNFGLIV